MLYNEEPESVIFGSDCAATLRLSLSMSLLRSKDVVIVTSSDAVDASCCCCGKKD